MKAVLTFAVFGLTLVPVTALAAQRPIGSRTRAVAVHDRAPRVRTRVISARPGR